MHGLAYLMTASHRTYCISTRMCTNALIARTVEGCLGRTVIALVVYSWKEKIYSKNYGSFGEKRVSNLIQKFLINLSLYHRTLNSLVRLINFI